MPAPIRVRIAPSPTGALHLGTIRTALFNYLFAKKNKGTFVIRVEDTDKERSTTASEQEILDGLEFLGLQADEGPRTGGDFGPYRQSERTDLYRPYLEQLIATGAAYHCFCTSETLDAEREAAEAHKKAYRYSGKCRSLSPDEVQQKITKGEKSVIRLRIQENTDIAYSDLIRGDTKQNTSDLTGDMVIAKDLDSPLYNFAVVIDDHLMQISHVIRGEDHISNTPKQILIYRAFGWKEPIFAHMPLILNADRTKLSKRKNPVSLDYFLSHGFIKEAFINFLALLGWNDGTEREIFTLEDLCEIFTIERVSKSGAIFDLKRLEWLNKEHIRLLDDKEIATRLFPFIINTPWALQDLLSEDPYDFEVVSSKQHFSMPDILKIIEVEKHKVTHLTDLVGSVEIVCTQVPRYERDLLIGKSDHETVKFVLTESLLILEQLQEWNLTSIKALFMEKITEWNMKNGEVLWPLRVALSGRDKSPGAFELLYVLGKEQSLLRIEAALKE